jgi:UDP-N-acetylmuramoyl-L-alanyl-D-glutamate--2,6-diaminopimelate ligase
VTEHPGVSLRTLALELEDAVTTGDEEARVRSIAFDSRLVKPETLFVALRGSYFDGHDYLGAARAAGACACVVDRDVPANDLDGFRATIRVPDSRAALATVAATFHRHPSAALTLVGITGTDGKTTSSFMLDHLLRAAGMRTGLIGTVAIRIAGLPERSPGRQTTPESLEIQALLAAMRQERVEVAILETSSHGLETHRVDGCLFDIGIVTNITHEHLDFHGTPERYRAAKAGLIQRVASAAVSGKLGVTILNMDDPGARSLEPLTAGTRLIRYGLADRGQLDVSASGLHPGARGIRFRLRLGPQEAEACLPLIGRWNVSNALAAVAAGHALNIDLDAIVGGLATMASVPGRMQPVEAGQPFQVVVDYAHTATALDLVLAAARESSRGNVLVVFGSAGERDVEKRSEMGAVAARQADYAVFTSEDPRHEDPRAIIDAIAAGALGRGAIEGVDFDRIEDRVEAIDAVIRRAEAGDIVLLAGKGHERSIIYGSEARPWDEAAVARAALERRGYVGSQ